MDTRDTRNLSSNLRTQLRRRQTLNIVPPGVCPFNGTHTNARFGANTSGDNYTPHRIREDTKSSGSPRLSKVNIFVPCGLAISSCGPTSIPTTTVKGDIIRMYSLYWRDTQARHVCTWIDGPNKKSIREKRD